MWPCWRRYSRCRSSNPLAPLHSETPGLIVDRMSILSLKIYHTGEEARRETATEAHRRRNQDRLAVLEEQRSDLAGCLDVLWRQIVAGERRFKLYRQMKMYNDPELNPVLYRRVGVLTRQLHSAYKTDTRQILM